MKDYGLVTYRIFTDLAGKTQIIESSLYSVLCDFCTVEFVTPLGERFPSVEWHVHWFQRSAAEAKLAGACPVFVPPDTLWADGSLGYFAARLAEGMSALPVRFFS